jgi:hypothetical protein
MRKTYHGSCHCGAVRFACELDLAAGTSKCNCSICTKARFWKAIVQAADFRLERGEDALADYRFGSKGIHHRFCRTCGVKPFGQGHLDEIGDFFGVNLACLDDATAEELSRTPVRYEDGRHDNWDSEMPQIQRRLL